jgi:lysophospholipase L1-like esterase
MKDFNFSVGKSPRPPYFADGVTRSTALLENIRPGSYDVVILGDSLAEAWPDYLWHPARTMILGNGGDRIENVTWRLTERAHDVLKTECIIYVAGTNNLWSGDDAKTTYATMKNSLRVVKDTWPSAVIVVLGIAPFGPPLEFINEGRINYNSYLKHDRDIESIDVEGAFAGNEQFYQDDHIHFSRSGYVALTSYVRDYISGLLG